MKRSSKILTALLASVMLLSGCSNGQATDTSQTGNEGQETNTAADEQETIDYENTDISEWFYAPETESETMNSFITIDGVQHGTAGGSLKEAIAGAELIELTKAEDFDEVLSEYIGGMNALQMDFFSFQTDMAYESAKAIFADFENQKLLLSDAGIEDFTIDEYSEEELDTLYGNIKEELSGMGVSDQWKNFPQVEPFNAVIG